MKFMRFSETYDEKIFGGILFFNLYNENGNGMVVVVLYRNDAISLLKILFFKRITHSISAETIHTSPQLEEIINFLTN